MSDPSDVTKAIRKRPGMYVGETDDGRGLHALIELLLDEALDEHVAGHGSRIAVILHADGSVTVEDDGRDEPVRIDQLPALESDLRRHRGAAATRRRTPWTGYTGGLHVGGVIVVNALSDWLELEVRSEGTTYHQRCIEGAPVAEHERADDRRVRGTKIRFHPDPQVFTNVLEFSFDEVAERLRDLAYLHRGLQTRLADERSQRVVEVVSERGIADYVSERSVDEPRRSDVIEISGQHGDTSVEVAMLWTSARHERMRCFTNSTRNAGGGSQLAGFEQALTAVFRTIASSSASSGSAVFTGEQLRRGLIAVISVRCLEPRYSSLDKDVLISPEVETAVATVVSERLGAYLAQHPLLARAVIARAGRASRAP